MSIQHSENAASTLPSVLGLSVDLVQQMMASDSRLTSVTPDSTVSTCSTTGAMDYLPACTLCIGYPKPKAVSFKKVCSRILPFMEQQMNPVRPAEQKAVGVKTALGKDMPMRRMMLEEESM